MAYQKQQNNVKGKNMGIKRGKVLSNRTESFRDFQGGIPVVLGIIEQVKKETGEPVLGKFGQELHTIECVMLEGSRAGEVVKFWADGGLRGTLKMLKLKEGDKVYITHMGEKEIDNGFVQDYQISEVVEE